MYCLIGLDCSLMGDRDGWCENAENCNHWADPWDLPLLTCERVSGMGNYFYRVVLIPDKTFLPPTEEGLLQLIDRDWHEYFARYGYAQAVDTPDEVEWLKRIEELEVSNCD